MIESIRIENFQSHRKTRFKLHPGVNVIIGPSDSGKTAILRALNWIIRNRPSGDEFRSSWGGDTIVQVGVEGLQHVSREKGKQGNRYTVASGEDSTKPIEEFKSFGQSVPEEISSLLNMDDVNIQSQMDAPFLLSESPGEVARALNRVAALEDIDNTHRRIKSIASKNTSTLESAKTRLDALEEEARGFAFLDEMESLVVKLERTEAEAESVERDAEKLEFMIGDLKALDKKKKKVGRTAKLMVPLKDILEREEKARKKEEEVTEFERAVSSLSNFIAKRDEIERSIKGWKKTFDDLMPNRCPLCGNDVIMKRRQ